MAPVPHRLDVAFTVGRDLLAAWFYPAGGTPAAPRPCVVMGHGFAGVKEARLDAFAERFAAAGIACVVFDYRNLGASDGEPRQRIDLARHRADWSAAIAYARTRPEVDAFRIGVWGTSLGGGLALELAARRRDLRCAVLQAPLVNAFATSEGEAPWHSWRLALHVVADIAGMLLRRPMRTIPVVGPYGSLAFMTQKEAEPGYFAIVRDAPSWRNRASVRTAAQLALFRPARGAKRVACPVLVVTGERDQVTPPHVTRRALRDLRDATFISYPGGHFDGYLGDCFELSAGAAVSFFRRTLELDGRPESAERVASPARR